MRGEELELEVDDLPARLAGADLRLTPPPRVSASYSILVALDQLASRDDRGVRPTHLVLCAALGMCWARVRSRLQFDGDVLSYGLRVIDLLLDPSIQLAPGDHPATMLDVIVAGKAAVKLIQRSAPILPEVKAAEDFSRAPSDASTASGSRSSDDGASSPDGFRR
jgi:hypothetical protein